MIDTVQLQVSFLAVSTIRRFNTFKKKNHNKLMLDNIEPQPYELFRGNKHKLVKALNHRTVHTKFNRNQSRPHITRHLRMARNMMAIGFFYF